MAELFPPQGSWSEQEYFDLNREPDVMFMRTEHADRMHEQYWIADPQLQHVTVLTLADGCYHVHGEFAAGENATSLLLSGFEVPVSDLLAIQ